MSRNFLVIRIWLILMVIAVSLMGTSVFAQSGTTVRVDPSNSSAQVNGNVNLSIKVDNITNLTALELHLSFNPGVLEVLQVTNGGFVAADFIAQNVFDNTAGTIDYAVAQMNRPAAQGSGTLLNIVFRAKANGSSTVALRGTQAVPSGLLLSDLNGIAIQASWVNGTVNVGGTSATNTPTPVTPATNTSTPVTPATVTPTPVTLATFTPTPVTLTTVTPVPATPTVVPPAPIPPTSGILGTHIVRWGESLYCIGRAYKVTPWSIAEVNHLWWPNLIFPYQSLLIPNVPWLSIPAGPVCQAQFTAAVPTTIPPTPTSVPPTPIPTIITSIPPTAIVATATAVPSSSCREYYIVRAGDNLFRIALRYGTNYTELARVNNIADPRLIYVGQNLCIP